MSCSMLLWAVLMLSTAFALESSGASKLSALKQQLAQIPGLPTTLRAGGSLTSTDVFFAQLANSGGFSAQLIPNGGFVVYAPSGPSRVKAIWDTKTEGLGTGPYKLSLGLDNNLVLSDTTLATIWSSGTSNKGTLGGGSILSLTNNGNLILADSTGVQLWSSNSGQASWYTGPPAPPAPFRPF